MGWAQAKWIVDNVTKKTGLSPNNMRAFTATSISNTQIGLRFLEPLDSYRGDELLCKVAGVVIRMSESGYPTSPTDGTLVIDNKDLGKYRDDAFVVNGLQKDKTYYFSAFPYSEKGIHNLSKDGANRVNTVAVGGEIVNVAITVDDASEFNVVTVRCVDETDYAETQAMSLNSATTATFIVPKGHTYHVEYDAVYGYSKPDNTASKVAVAGSISNYSATYSYFTATINVTYPVGAVLTCYNGDKVYTAGSATGSYQFKVHAVGAWTVKAVDGGYTDIATVEIQSKGQTSSVSLAFANIYGVSRDISSSSPVWARTDDAVGKTATASVGTNPGSSDFDTCYPWSEMKRESVGSDTMVKIPKFYYRRYREGSIEHIKIADKPAEGFKLHPAFNHAGLEKDSVYVGAYKTSTAASSVTDATPLVSVTRPAFRDNAKSKGSGWGIIDISTVSAIQMLVMVEFATNDVQTAIGNGITNAGGKTGTGHADGVPNLTGRQNDTDSSSEVVYRGIEGFWGHVWEWVDGVNWNSGTYYVCNDPSKYADTTATGYEALSYKGATNWNLSYITEEGLDNGENTHVMLPSAAGTGNSSSYYGDAAWSSSAWRVIMRGGGWTNGLASGLFTVNIEQEASSTDVRGGSRLLYIPQ